MLVMSFEVVQLPGMPKMLYATPDLCCPHLEGSLPGMANARFHRRDSSHEYLREFSCCRVRWFSCLKGLGLSQIPVALVSKVTCRTGRTFTFVVDMKVMDTSSHPFS